MPPMKMDTMGMMISSVRLLVMVENAAPMMVPTASAMALPLMAKAANSSHQEGFFTGFFMVRLPYFFSMTSMPPRYFRRASGTTTEPSAL